MDDNQRQTKTHYQVTNKHSILACLNFKRSCVGALSMFHVAVTNAVGKCHLPYLLSEFTLEEPHY